MGLSFVCECHNKQVKFIVLQSKEEGSRLLCSRCNLNEQSFLFRIDKIIKFASKCTANEQEIEQIISKLKYDYQNLRSQVLAMLQKQENNIQKLVEQFEKDPRIVPKDYVSIFLEKNTRCSKREALNMANQLESLLFQENKLSTNRYEYLHNCCKEKIAKNTKLKPIKCYLFLTTEILKEMTLLRQVNSTTKNLILKCYPRNEQQELFNLLSQKYQFKAVQTFTTKDGSKLTLLGPSLIKIFHHFLESDRQISIAPLQKSIY